MDLAFATMTLLEAMSFWNPLVPIFFVRDVDFEI